MDPWLVHMQLVTFFEIRGCFIGCYACNLGSLSIFESELHGFTIVMEYVVQHSWLKRWLEADSSSAILAFKNLSLIPYYMRNRWLICFHLGLHVFSFHIFHEENGCTCKHANHGYAIHGIVGWEFLP